MDGIDYRILRILQKNARETASNISKEIHLSVSAVIERIRKMEETGVIKEYTIIVNEKKTGNEMTAFRGADPGDGMHCFLLLPDRRFRPASENCLPVLRRAGGDSPSGDESDRSFSDPYACGPENRKKYLFRDSQTGVRRKEGKKRGIFTLLCAGIAAGDRT